MNWHMGKWFRKAIPLVLGAAVLGLGGHAVRAAGEAGSNATAMTVTLLGTGSPVPLTDRYGPSTLVEAGGRKFLFDAGRGAPMRLAQLGIPLGEITGVFLTHFHSDHLNGLPDFWMTSYVPVAFGARSQPMKLWGPEGTVLIGERMRAAFADDIRIRMADAHVKELATQIDVKEFNADGVVYDEGGVRVTAFKVNHGELIHPSYGYRVDYQGHSVLISGDTKYEPNIIKNGQGLDLLIHEVCAVPAEMAERPNIKQVINHHTSPQEAGKIFTQTRPKMAAYTHLVLLGDRKHAPLGPKDLEQQTRETYSGPLTVGEDLTRFEIGDGVRVRTWDAGKQAYANP